MPGVGLGAARSVVGSWCASNRTKCRRPATAEPQKGSSTRMPQVTECISTETRPCAVSGSNDRKPAESTTVTATSCFKWHCENLLRTSPIWRNAPARHTFPRSAICGYRCAEPATNWSHVSPIASRSGNQVSQDLALGDLLGYLARLHEHHTEIGRRSGNNRQHRLEADVHDEHVALLAFDKDLLQLAAFQLA